MDLPSYSEFTTQGDQPTARAWVMRQAGQVTRMHVLPTVGVQDVAQHTFNAMHIYMDLCKANMLDPREGLIKLLYHDVEEVWVGDMPANTKRTPGVKDAMKQAEHDFRDVFNIQRPYASPLQEQNIPVPEPMGVVNDLTKAADSIELMMYCIEQRRRGNRERRIAQVMVRAKNYAKEKAYLPGVRDWIVSLMSEWNSLCSGDAE